MAGKNTEKKVECSPKIEGSELMAWIKKTKTPTRITFVGTVLNCGNYAEGYCAIAGVRCCEAKRLTDVPVEK